jgi:hypothetical protein
VKAAAAVVALELPGTDTGKFPDGKLRQVDGLRLSDAIKRFRSAMCTDLKLSPEQQCDKDGA